MRAALVLAALALTGCGGGGGGSSAPSPQPPVEQPPVEQPPAPGPDLSDPWGLAEFYGFGLCAGELDVGAEVFRQTHTSWYFTGERNENVIYYTWVEVKDAFTCDRLYTY